MKICFLAPSGYGKDTAVLLLSKYFNILNIKIANPLYEMQRYFYKTIDIDIEYKQDGELLQFFGVKIRKENPNYLLDRFKQSLSDYEKDDNLIITNDDCRVYDYECLKELGFIFIKINGFKRNRDDQTIANPNLKLEWQTEIPYDYEVDNYSDINNYEKELLKVMEEIINDRKVLPNTYTKRM